MENLFEIDKPEIYCDNGDCHYSKHLSKEIKFLKCPNCNRRNYHSEICLYNDSKHFSLCAVQKLKKIKKSRVIRMTTLSTKLLINSLEVDINYKKSLGSGGFGDVNLIVYLRFMNVIVEERTEQLRF